MRHRYRRELGLFAEDLLALTLSRRLPLEVGPQLALRPYTPDLLVAGLRLRDGRRELQRELALRFHRHRRCERSQGRERQGALLESLNPAFRDQAAQAKQLMAEARATAERMKAEELPAFATAIASGSEGDALVAKQTAPERRSSVRCSCRLPADDARARGAIGHVSLGSSVVVIVSVFFIQQ